MASGGGRRSRDMLDSYRRVPGEGDGEDEETNAADDDLYDDNDTDSHSDVSILSDNDLADDSELSAAEDPTAASKPTDAAHDASSARKSRRSIQTDKKVAAGASAKDRSGKEDTSAAASAAAAAAAAAAATADADVSDAPPDVTKGQAADETVQTASRQQQDTSKATVSTRRRHQQSTSRSAGAVPGKEYHSDPATVPNRGGFFMHDHRGESFGRGGQTSYGRGRGVAGAGRGRPAGSSHQAGNFHRPVDDTMASRWTHNLYESIDNPAADTTTSERAPPHIESGGRPASMAALLSKTVAIGTVTARVYLPSMKAPINFERMPVKQHTRLPDLRPPLRRDKPVRISMPDAPPRYIFPSTERSFIFIPRAQRPNQQGGRNKGRGGGYFSQHGSRRQSAYGGSNYTPSVAMSRRSSVAVDGIVSPTGSARPVVKLPFNTQAVPYAPAMQPGVVQPATYPLPSQPTFHGAQSQIPMHQPRPQKAVSLATIETPGADGFQAPPQQEQQPFHHQVPMQVAAHTRHMSTASQASGNTPLSNIPERAVNAPAFQPAAMAAAPMFGQYPAYQYYYPDTASHAPPPYMMPAMVPVMAAAHPGAGEVTVQQQQHHHHQHHLHNNNHHHHHNQQQQQHQHQHQHQHQQQFAHQANGMVYFYDHSQMAGAGMEGAGGLHTPAPEGFWQPAPPMMYYGAPPQ